MPYSDYLKRRALHFYAMGLSPRAIADALAAEGLSATRQGLALLIKRYNRTGTVERCVGSGRPSTILPWVKAIVESQMREDDETTAVQLAAILSNKGYKLSLSTILRSRRSLGWTFRGSAYCQMIRHPNKLKRLEWAQRNVHEAKQGSWTSSTRTRRPFSSSSTAAFAAESAVNLQSPSQSKHCTTAR